MGQAYTRGIQIAAICIQDAIHNAKHNGRQHQFRTEQKNERRRYSTYNEASLKTMGSAHKLDRQKETAPNNPQRSDISSTETITVRGEQQRHPLQATQPQRPS